MLEWIGLLTVWRILWLRNLNNIEVSGRVVKDLVHLLQASVCGLGVEEVHARHNEGVDDCENDVCLISDRGKCDRGDHNDHEVEDPVGGGRQSA